MLVDFAVLEDLYDPAFIEDDTAVGHLLDLGNFQGVDDDGFPLLGKAEDELVDFFLRTHVHALGRVVEEKHVGTDVQPAGQKDLLLVAAGEGENAVRTAVGLDVKGLLLRLIAPVLLTHTDEGLFSTGELMFSQIEVLHNGHVGHDGVLLPVGRQHGDAVVHKPDNAAVQAFPIHQHVAAL